MLDTIRWQVLLVALAGWVNRRQLEVIAYLREENPSSKNSSVGNTRCGPQILRPQCVGQSASGGRVSYVIC
jgi:hypothetical protein